MYLRKRLAGSTSHGYTWDEDGQVIEVDDEHGAELLRLPDGGFEPAEPPEADDEPPADEVPVLVDDEQDTDVADEVVEEPAPEVEADLAEPEPDIPEAVDEAPKRRVRKPKE